MKRHTSLVVILIWICITAVRPFEVPGSLSLESLTFDKVVKSFTSTLVKFDKAYAFGEAQDEFKVISRLCAKNENLIVAEVAVNEYGEKENQDLAERYNIKADDYPQYRLFRGDSQNPIIHDGEMTHIAVIRFLRRHGIYVPLDGCSQRLDEFAAQFMKATGDEKSRQAVRNQLRERSESFSIEQAEDLKTYLSLMKNIIGKDEDFIQNSVERMKTIIDRGKLAENKKKALEKKVNVLRCFLLSTVTIDPGIPGSKTSDPQSAGGKAKAEL